MSAIFAAIALLGETVVLGGVPLGYACYDHYWKTEWQRYSAELAEQGEILDIDELLDRSPLPDRRNFAAAPLIADIFTPGDHAPKLETLQLENIGFQLAPRAPKGLARWQVAEPKNLTLYLHGAEISERPSEDVQRLLAPHEAVFAKLASAASRRDCRFPLDWEMTFAMKTPHTSQLTNAALVTNLRALCAVRESDSGSSLLDVSTTFQIAGHLQREPLLIDMLVATTILNDSEHVLWEGLRKRLWDDSDLIFLDRTIQQIDVGKALIKTMKAERAMVIRGFDDARLGRFPSEEMAGATMFPAGLIPMGVWHEAIHAQAQLFQIGFFDQPTYPGSAIPQYDDTSVMEMMESWKKAPPRPGKLLASAVIPVFATITERVLQHEAYLRLARIAIALERHHLAHRSYPKALQELSPAFLEALPVDPVTGSQFRYVLRPDGRPAVWSIGLNEVDNGGRPKKKRDLGDWVWQYSMPVGYSESDYLSKEALPKPKPQ